MAVTETTRIDDHFSLRPMAGALRNLQPPGKAPRPDGAWSAEFVLYTLANRPWPTGSLTLVRTPHEEGAELNTDYSLACGSGVTFRTGAEVLCAPGALGTPSAWTVATRQLDAQGKETPDVFGEFRGAYDGTHVVIKQYGKERSVSAGTSLAWSWGLFDAVQRLAVNPPSEPLTFALLDHFDQVKPGHALRLRKRCRLLVGTEFVVEEQAAELEHGTVFRPRRVERGGTTVDCVVFEQTGRGILPIVYWCTTDGRLLMVSTGLEAYVRKTEEAR